MNGIADTVDGKLRMRMTRWAVVLGKDEAAHFVLQPRLDEHQAGAEVPTFGSQGCAEDYVQDKKETHRERELFATAKYVPVIVEVRQVSEREFMALYLRWYVDSTKGITC